MKTFRILGLLLSYPSKDLQTYMGEMKQALIDEEMIKGRNLKKLLAFMDDIAKGDLIDFQENYVALFDKGRGHSLYLFEHVHGESRDRGPAMVDLIETYKEHGFTMTPGELPDYMPLFLEFLSVLPAQEAQAYLTEPLPIFATIGVKLKDRKSDYYKIFNAIEALSDAEVDPEILEKALQSSQMADESFEALDKEWEEKPAFTGDPEADVDNSCKGCPVSAPAPLPFQSVNNTVN